DGLFRIFPPGEPPKPVVVLPAGSGSPPVLAFAPDRPILAVAQSRQLRWWDVLKGGWQDGSVSEKDDITAVAYTPDGKHLAVATRGPDILLRSLATGQKIHTLRGHRGGVAALACHPDGQVLASGSSDGDVRLWDLR